MRFLLMLCLAAGFVSSAYAAEVDHVQVHHVHDRYVVHARLTLDVGQAAAFRAATSFQALAARARLIDSSKRIGDHRLSSVLSMCVLFYCKTVHQVVDYRLDPPKTIAMQVVPDAGDFKSGSAHWHFQAAGPARSIVIFDSSMVPNFWVPPMIGDWAIAHALKAQIADTGRAIEALAKASPGDAARAENPGSAKDDDHGR